MLEGNSNSDVPQMFLTNAQPFTVCARSRYYISWKQMSRKKFCLVGTRSHTKLNIVFKTNISFFGSSFQDCWLLSWIGWRSWRWSQNQERSRGEFEFLKYGNIGRHDKYWGYGPLKSILKGSVKGQDERLYYIMLTHSRNLRWFSLDIRLWWSRFRGSQRMNICIVFKYFEADRNRTNK